MTGNRDSRIERTSVAIGRYILTRILTVRIVGLCLFLMLAVWVVHGRIGRLEALAGLGLTASLVVQFRLWDDLESVQADQLRYPGRVLCSVRHRGVFWAIMMIAGVANGALLGRWAGPPGWIAFGWLVVMTLMVYRWWPSGGAQDEYGLSRLAVLVKYPVIVAVLGWRGGELTLWSDLAALLVVAASLVAFELHDDPRFVVSKYRPRLVFWSVAVLAFSGPLLFEAGWEGDQRVAGGVLILFIVGFVPLVLPLTAWGKRNRIRLGWMSLVTAGWWMISQRVVSCGALGKL